MSRRSGYSAWQTLHFPPVAHFIAQRLQNSAWPHELEANCFGALWQPRQGSDKAAASGGTCWLGCAVGAATGRILSIVIVIPSGPVDDAVVAAGEPLAVTPSGRSGWSRAGGGHGDPSVVDAIRGMDDGSPGL